VICIQFYSVREYHLLLRIRSNDIFCNPQINVIIRSSNRIPSEKNF
jgi:hypothetical protein